MRPYLEMLDTLTAPLLSIINEYAISSHYHLNFDDLRETKCHHIYKYAWKASFEANFFFLRIFSVTYEHSNLFKTIGLVYTIKR